MKKSVKEKLEALIASTGSSYIDYDTLTRAHCSRKDIIEACKKHEIVFDTDTFGIRTTYYYTLPYLKNAEKQIAKMVYDRVNTKNSVPDLSEAETDVFIEEFEKQSGFSLHEEQKYAVKMAVNAHMAIITGGPGTGKTTVLNAVRYVEEKRYGKRPHEVFLAPTGKAARRMTEAVGVEAMTIQREIGANEYEDTPYIIGGDVVYVDEISMLDTVVMYQLLRSLTLDTRLIMLGDVDQLPSVGAGRILLDLIDSDEVPYTKLEKTFRQAEGSVLMDNIKLIKSGQNCLANGDDFEFITDYDENDTVKVLLDSYMEALKSYDRQDVILLTPYRRKGATCANEMNKLLQNLLNPDSPSVDADVVDVDEFGEEYTLHVNFRIGDPVMQLVNRFDCPVSNGDVGEVIDVYTDNSIAVKYSHYLKYYTVDELKELNLAYAMSVHKSQGSEYKCVITCAFPEHKQLLNRNMVYTAITRAKKKCIFFCKKDVLKEALHVEGAYIRDTLLCQKIQAYAKSKAA